MSVSPSTDALNFGAVTVNPLALNWAGTTGAISIVNVGGGATSAAITGGSTATAGKGLNLANNNIAGIAVHIAARIIGHAGAGEILVDRTVRDLVVGSGTGFEDRGNVELRGVPGTWQLLAVNRHGPRPGSPEAELASIPTPGRRITMRRSDRAVEVIARRTPWLLRGVARLAATNGRR